ncbi:alpha/beta fold hydrolase [Microbacterium sp. bgisy203]|uniref:alpha/beta fold hydrolase n=1 Tax=Microbacterium sp. bgisy203 TaxID=3413799 RepID=UPI003D743A2E
MAKDDGPVEKAADAVDTAIDELTGVPTDDGDIEEFSYDGATLIAEKRGDQASPRTVVLVHGIGMGRKVFADLTQRLEDDALVVSLDLPGYGDAPEPPRTPTMERLGDLVAAYLRHLDRGPVTLIGHSMGTQVVTETAVRHPATVRRLVLVAPTVDRHHRSAFAQLIRLGLDLLGESPKVLILGAREYLRAGPHLGRKMHAMLVHRPEDSYPRVAAPTLVVRGEDDPVAPPEWCDEVVAAIPSAESVEIAGHGHETLIRDAGPAAEAIRAFAQI